MKRNIMFIGVDVDDKSFHGSAFDPITGEIKEFKSRPTLKGLLNQLAKIEVAFPDNSFKICYEASYIGFTLQRDLTAAGYHCDVIAPSSIPRRHGNQIKTDRVDATKLAHFYASGILTIVIPPDPEMEKDRDFLRSRQYILKQLSETRGHIQSMLRRNGLHFKKETNYKSHWTRPHFGWIESTIKEQSGSLKRNLELLYQQMKWLEHTLSEYDKHVDELAESQRYSKKVQALTCYKGIKNIFAMVIITEIGNIERFSHPRQLTSWVGMDIREYSSGGKHNRFGITKHGNRYLRTALIEANQKAFRSKVISGALKTRRKGTPPELVHIADRCLTRLAKKGNRLLLAGKNPNKVKVACAREMVGFVWESLRAVA